MDELQKVLDELEKVLDEETTVRFLNALGDWIIDTGAAANVNVAMRLNIIAIRLERTMDAGHWPAIRE